jgi:hypothetical protein
VWRLYPGVWPKLKSSNGNHHKAINESLVNQLI